MNIYRAGVLPAVGGGEGEESAGSEADQSGAEERFLHEDLQDGPHQPPLYEVHLLQERSHHHNRLQLLLQQHYCGHSDLK